MSSERAVLRRRLHPAGIAVMAVDSLRQAALPLLLAFGATLFGGDSDAMGLARIVGFTLIATAAAVLLGYVRWRSTTYAVTDDAIEYRTGVVSVREASVPLGRVQSLDSVQGILQRVFGVVAVQVQAAGGGKKAEIVLSAVSPADLAELRAAVAGAHPEAVAASAPERRGTYARVSPRRLAAAAATQGQVAIVLPILAGAVQLLRDVFSDSALEQRAIGLVPDSVGEALLALALLGVAGWAVSALGTVIAFAGFTLERDGGRLRIARGLLQRREAIVPVRRVQAVRVVEGLLREPFGLASLRVEVAGYAADASSAQTLFPLVRRTEVEPLLRRMLPELAVPLEPLAPPPRRALRRFLVEPLALAVVPAAAAWIALAAARPWALALLVPAAWWGVARYRATGWRVDAAHLALRSRRLARTTVLAPVRRIQQHDLEQTLWQRRGRLASLEVALGAGTRARVDHLELEVAGRVFDDLRPGNLGACSARAPSPPSSTD
jgi:putative membrane protein